MSDIPAVTGANTGAKKLKESPSGRRLLSRLQKEREIDLLQPNDPRFHKVYGDRIKKQEETHRQQVSASNDLWGEKSEKESFQKRREIGTKKFF